MKNRRVLGAAVAALLVGSLGVLAGCASDAKPDVALTSQQVQAASVSLTVNDAQGNQVASGSGILIAPRLVLTSAHLVAGNASWGITSADGRTKVKGIRGMTYDWMDYDNSQKAHPRKHDLAVIYLDKPINLDVYPKMSEEVVPSGTAGSRLRSNGASYTSIPATFTHVKTFPHSYVTSFDSRETVEPGNAVLNEHNEIIGVVTGKGLTTGQLYVARVAGMTDWIAPKAQCGGRANSSVRTYGTPPPKPGCDTSGNGTSSGGTSGTGTSSGGTSGTTSGGTTSGGTSGTGTSSGGSSGTSGTTSGGTGTSSGGSSGTSGTSGNTSGGTSGTSGGASSSGGVDNPACSGNGGGGYCHGDCSGVPGGSSSSGGSSSGSSGANGNTSGGTTSGGTTSSGGTSGTSGTTTSSGGTSSGGSSGTSGTNDNTSSSGTSGTTTSSGGTSSGGSSGTSGTTTSSGGSSGTSGTSGQTSSSGSSGETTSSSGSSGTSGQTTSSGGTSSGGGGDDNEVCEGPTDNPESCPTEPNGCTGDACGGAYTPDANIDYGACVGCSTSDGSSDDLVVR